MKHSKDILNWFIIRVLGYFQTLVDLPHRLGIRGLGLGFLRRIMLHEALVCVGMLLPFPFYWLLWTQPTVWVNLCGTKDPCHTMATVSSVLKFIQLFALGSVVNLESPLPPFWIWILIFLGQALNSRVYQLLGEDGVYYGVRFGKNIPWVSKFPYGYMRDPQYMGSILSLLGCLYWVPFPYIALWCTGYVFMMYLERHEDISTRVKKNN